MSFVFKSPLLNFIKFLDSSEIRVEKIVKEDNIPPSISSEREENINNKIEQVEDSNLLEDNKKSVNETLQTATSVKDENLKESEKTEENAAFEEVPQANYVEKIGEYIFNLFCLY